MRSWNLDGRCRCGQVRIGVTAPPLLTMACHCTGCQRMSASAFSLSAAFPAPNFSVTRGEPVIGGIHGPDAHHHCCPHCKSWMFTRPEGIDHFVNVRPTMLEDASWVAPFIETYTQVRLPGAATAAKHSYETFPPFEEFAKLMEEFAKEGARPSR